MPLIQRNLFPARPPKAKCDGPSVLKATKSSSAKAIVPTLQSTLNNNLDIKSRAVISSSAASASSSKAKAKAKSASLSSLLVLSGSSTGRGGSATAAGRQPTVANHFEGSHESFQCSTDSSDPSASLSSSSSSVDASLISRRRIVSRSRDALGGGHRRSEERSEDEAAEEEDEIEEDRWHCPLKLIEDHVEEIVSKWEQIDDEIWAKVICMERDRRVAKAYARAPELRVDGGGRGFDGHRIGLAGFANPRRDPAVEEVKRGLTGGVRVRMDGRGNLMARRVDAAPVWLLRPEAAPVRLDRRQATLLFDMATFQAELLRELRAGCSSSARALEAKCFCFLGFGPTSEKILATPVWVILINLVALEMVLKVLPSRIVDDNFYSLPVSNGSNPTRRSKNSPNSSSSIPPKLPPRDLHNAKPPLTLPEPDYDDESTVASRTVTPMASRSLDDLAHLLYKHQMKNKVQDEDLYYFGLSAHVPKFSNNNNTQNLAPTPVTSTTNSSRSNPPIVRKKFWSQSSGHFKFFGGSSKKQSQKQQPTPNASYERKIQTLDYRGSGGGTSSGYYSGPSHLPPSQFYPQQPPSHRPRPTDNNDIYGVNTSLLRRNCRQAQQSRLVHGSRSSSSPSLQHALMMAGFGQRGKGGQMDLNNNRI